MLSGDVPIAAQYDRAIGEGGSHTVIAAFELSRHGP
jgi:hypothetical protein